MNTYLEANQVDEDDTAEVNVKKDYIDQGKADNNGVDVSKVQKMKNDDHNNNNSSSSSRKTQMISALNHSWKHMIGKK